ncbi:hypothetical protein COT29_00745 [Candidatus Micrarchaeota archaeon CG08_land_8_20_14_0_20_59_11]|nr:MAG: hypothetical protein COT29_00745 [Candidatus Micrarchaeota archaeon CG08_land_8_20_14_0_20_59_11]
MRGAWLFLFAVFALAPLAMAAESLLPAGATLIFNETQIYTKRLAPLVCQKLDIDVTIWREMNTYNITTTDRFGRKVTKNYSTFKVTIKNTGNVSLKNVLLKERLPGAVAQRPDELMNFTVPPSGFEEGSVVVTWLFDNMNPGEEKEVSYTVEKQLDKQVLDEFEAPQVVVLQQGAATATPAAVEQAPEPPQDNLLPIAIGVLIVAVGGVLFYFIRKAQSSA